MCTAQNARKGKIMKYNTVKKAIGMAAVIMLSAALFGGCGQREEMQGTESISQSGPDAAGDLSTEIAPETEAAIGEEADTETTSPAAGGVSELVVRFGDEGEPFMMRLEENETAAAIARHVGTSDWRLPIYERDDNADYDVMQYYDVSNRYEIPSDPEAVTSEKAGEVYYSDPNRIILFYHDAEITGEYTKIGTFEATEEFVTAVEENPVLEGWGNKIVQISQP